jgi:hypothetical protein
VRADVLSPALRGGTSQPSHEKHKKLFLTSRMNDMDGWLQAREEMDSAQRLARFAGQHRLVMIPHQRPCAMRTGAYRESGNKPEAMYQQH